MHVDPGTGDSFLLVFDKTPPHNAAIWDLNVFASYFDGCCSPSSSFFFCIHVPPSPPVRAPCCAGKGAKYLIPLRGSPSLFLREFEEAGSSTPLFFLRLHLAFEVERRLVGWDWLPHSRRQVQTLERAVDASAVLWRRFLGNIRSQSSREEVLPPSCCFRQGPPNPSCCACPLSLQRHPAPPLCTRKTQGRDAHDFPRTFSQVLAQRDKALKDCRTVRLGILCWRASLEKVLAVARGNPARLEKMLETAEQEQRSRPRGRAPALSSRNMKSRRDRGAGMPAKHRRLLLQWRRDCWGTRAPPSSLRGLAVSEWSTRSSWRSCDALGTVRASVACSGRWRAC